MYGKKLKGLTSYISERSKYKIPLRWVGNIHYQSNPISGLPNEPEEAAKKNFIDTFLILMNLST
jgi:hypothetical protein